MACGYIGVEHAVALNSGTAALHLALKLAVGRVYGSSSGIFRDVFQNGLCLPSDIKMTEEEQGLIIEMIVGCFNYGFA